MASDRDWSIEEVFPGISPSEKILVKRLRVLVQECLPYATEKGYYGMGIPYFSHHRMICFIWPSSVVWGPKSETKKQTFKGVSLGFCQGNMMSNEDGALKAEGRKQVYILYIKSIDELDEAQVRSLLFEAGMVDDEFGERKKLKKKKKR
jgi:hypothetical protein